MRLRSISSATTSWQPSKHGPGCSATLCWTRHHHHPAGDQRRGEPGVSEAWQGRHPEGQQGPGSHKRRRDESPLSPSARTDTYGVGETIRFTVTFDTPVAVDTTSGTPVLGFRLANSSTTPANKDLDYVSGSGTAALTFEYVVQSGDTDTNGISVRNNWLDANDGPNGAITHPTTGRDARLNHGRPGNNGNFRGHKVDGSLAPSVPNDWALKPSGFGGGDQFRLIFLTSYSHATAATPTSRSTTTSSGIRPPTRPATPPSRHTRAAFNVVGCTASIDARDNTHTTYTNANKGVPIYWLNGLQVADDYEDFYDGSWDARESTARTRTNSAPMGPIPLNVGKLPLYRLRPRRHRRHSYRRPPGPSATAPMSPRRPARVLRLPATAPSAAASEPSPGNEPRPMYGLSAVFERGMTDAVAARRARPTSPPPLTPAETEIDLSWTAPTDASAATPSPATRSRSPAMAPPTGPTISSPTPASTGHHLLPQLRPVRRQHALLPRLRH